MQDTYKGVECQDCERDDNRPDCFGKIRVCPKEKLVACPFALYKACSQEAFKCVLFTRGV